MEITNSSNIRAIDYDAEGLLVTFKNERKYRYVNVTEETYEALVSEAVSPGGSVGALFARIVCGIHVGTEVLG